MNSSEDIWFSGPVQDAVSLVAERNCVFLVYIFGMNSWSLCWLRAPLTISFADDSDKSNTLNVVLKDQKVFECTVKYYTVF